jgi:hypothetical protein
VNHDQVTGLHIFMLQKEKACLAFYATRFAAGHEAIDFYHSHRNAQTHDSLLTSWLIDVLE